MKYLKYIFLVVAVGFFTSCEDYFSGDFSNEDPDNPLTVTPNVILPQVQLRLTYTLGGDFARYVGIYTQHVTGVSRQFAVIGAYGIVPSDVSTMWSNIYTGTMQSNRLLLKDAEELGNNYYAGISLALEAYAMLISTDVWGDIAYSDAFKFDENGGLYTPTFDGQEAVYTQIFDVIDRARGYFAGDGGGNTPGIDDLVYGGDAGQWTKFLNVLEARARLHLAERNSNAYAEALAALDKGGFESNADNGGVAYGNAATENAPWFQYIEQRDDCEIGTAYKEMLGALNDPRDATYGWPHDNDHPIWTKDQTVDMLTYAEAKFIEAEAALMTQNASRAYAAYLEGIRASMEMATTADYDVIGGYDNYIAQANIGVGEGNLTLEDIITQKWIALYTDPEVFSDWRRTGFPELTPVNGSQIPRRLPYAETELLSNPDNVPSTTEVDIFTPVWWDAN